MITANFRYVPVTLLVLSLSGCQSPGSFASLFGKKDDPALAAAQSERDPAAGDSTRLGGLFGNRAVDDELRLARQARDQGRPVSARISFEKVLQLQPRNVEAHEGLAVICDQMGSYREAENHYRQAIELSPRDAALHSNLGYSYYKQGRTSDAARELQIALELEPTHRKALYNLGLVRGTQGNREQALALFRQAVPEDQALAAMAQFTPADGFGGQPEMSPQFASGNPNGGVNEPDLQNLNPATRELMEFMKKERAAQGQQQVAMQNKRAQDSRISAPAPGGRNVVGHPAAYSRPTADEQRQQVLKYLQDGRPNPAEWNRLFDRIDRGADATVAQSPSSRSGPPSPDSSYLPQNPAQGSYGAGVQGASTAGLPASYQQNQAWTNAQGQSSAGFGDTAADPTGLWNQPANSQPTNPQMASSSGLPDWNPLPMRNQGQGTAQNVSASRQISGPFGAPQITPRNSNSRIQGSMNAPLPGPPANGRVPLWNSAGGDQQSSLPNWSENSLPAAPQGGPGSISGDEFAPIPGQAGQTTPWNGMNQTSAQPANYSGVIQASGIQPVPDSSRTQTSPTNTYEQARLAAAQMGLNAGSGSPFQPGESTNSSFNAVGSQPGQNRPEYSGPQNAPPEGLLSPHYPVQGAVVPAAVIPSAQGLVYGENLQNTSSPNRLTLPQVPRAMVPSAQGMVYGQTREDPSQGQMLQSSATETLRQRLQHEQKMQALGQGQQSQLPQWQANSRSTAPGNAYPSFRPGPRALPTDADLPQNGGFPGQ